jgi:O-acetyl-ADP-ribose deacetylase (regulator of RNase III)/NAD-dependent SIR2 family protein deacetylase
MNIPVISRADVVRQIVQNKGSFAAWVGAGCSAEAGIKTGRQICESIREELTKNKLPASVEEWTNRELHWNDPRRRYSTCLKRHAPAADQRVEYFRSLLKDKAPAFSHQALALLMSARMLKRTCFTTNFDKLIEVAFAQQGYTEFQVIRNESETPFWRQDGYDKSFILKLHGDYDAFNIQNTLDETIRIQGELSKVAGNALRSSGLIVLGASGFEDSVIRFFNDVIDADPSERKLSLGLYWAVNISAGEDVDDEARIEATVRKKIHGLSISPQIREIFERAAKKDFSCGFFPVVGAAGFFLDLVRATEDNDLILVAERYLGHEMRLRRHLAARGLEQEAVEARISRITEHQRQRRLSFGAQDATPIFGSRFVVGARTIIVVHGDLASTLLLDAHEFAKSRRAVVSPDDDLLTAGAGAALALLIKAGQGDTLRELLKFQNVGHCEVAVTSGGNLPVNFILHAAATRILLDGTAVAEPQHVKRTFSNVLRMCEALAVETVITPLIAAGSSGLKPIAAARAILEACADHADGFPQHVLICIRDRHYIRDEEWVEAIREVGIRPNGS